MWEKLKGILKDSHFGWVAASAAFVIFFLLSTRLPRPPEPGIVATYHGGEVTEEELRRYLHEYLPRCPKHLRCSRHGEDHYSCTDQEQCETFIGCGDEHRRAHTLPVYRQAAGSLVVDRLVGDLVAKKKLGEKKTARHLMKHVTEEINISDLHRDWHKGKIRVEESEVREYYEKNRGGFGARTLSEVAEEIRATLTQEKERAFVQNYLRELRENSGVSINYDLLKYPEPDEGQLRTAFFERRDEFRRPARVKLLLVESAMDSRPDAGRELAREVRSVLLSGALPSEVRESLNNKPESFTVRAGVWVSEKDALWRKMTLARYFRGEVTEVVVDRGKVLVARVEERQEPGPQRFEDVKEQLVQRVAEELRVQHLKENLNSTLFTVHGEPYSLGDFMEEFEELTPLAQASYSTFDSRKKLVDSMVQRSLIVEDASDELRSQKNRKQIDRIRRAVLKKILHNEEVDDKITLTEEELRKFFAENKHYYRQPGRVKINYIRLAAMDDQKQARKRAEKVLAELRVLPANELDGDGFARVAKLYSDDPDVASTGGRIEDWISEGGDVITEVFYHDFHKNVLSLNEGELSPVFLMGDSFYIVFVREREETRQRTFEEVREFVHEDLSEAKHYELTTTMEVELVKKAGAKIYDYTLLQMLKQESRERK